MRSSGLRLSRAAAGVCAAALTVTAASSAEAFNLKRTSDGLDVRWAEAQVPFVVDPRLAAHVPGASDAVAAAVHSWSGVAGAPTLTSSTGTVSPLPAVDGKNTVLYLRNFAAAGGALAITIVSVEASTGHILDTDIVINADHAFAVLPADARPAKNSPLVSTEGNSKEGASQVFDLTHVAAHEVGHSLGLADESTNAAALMYPYTRAGDASVRVPGSDDVSGIDEDYANADLSSGSAQGCGGGASVAGRRTGIFSFASAVLLAAFGWLISRRRRGFAPVALVLAFLVARPGEAHSATPSPVEATARVTGITTQRVDGVFQTTLELTPQTCLVRSCPDRALATVWGGTLDGITQQVGENVVPALADQVDVAFSTSAPENLVTAKAVVLALHPSD
jgi:hypothetical protein